MKIGIVTFHRAHNYGALLQAYALQSVITNMGHDVKIVDYYNHYLYGQYRVFKPVSKNPLKTLKHLVTDVLHYRKNKARYDSFEYFIDTKLYLGDKDVNKYDCLITGSDQVWNANLTRGLDDVYALNIDNDALKISYAASVGDSKIVYENADEYKQKLQKMDYVSVREDSAAVALGNILKKKVDVNLDPTLLLTSEQWRQNISDVPLENGEYIFAYSVGCGNTLFYDTVNKIAKDKNLKVVNFERKSNWYKAGPLDFLNLLLNSQYVVTSSFHGLALSLLFHKNVFVIANNKPERLLSLLKKVGAEKLIINDVSDIEKHSDDILDWNDVDSKMENLRKESMSWLEQKLSEEKK